MEITLEYLEERHKILKNQHLTLVAQTNAAAGALWAVEALIEDIKLETAKESKEEERKEE